MKFNTIVNNLIIQLIVSIIICVITRLPYLTGPHLYFDGDEAIVGIMAQDFLHGKNIPVYFYGQQYGFSFFEVLGVAIGILLFGNTVLALKTGGLLIYSVGIFFLLRLCIKKSIPLGVSLCIIFAICCYPPWLLWATKPRGGYITAFTCVCALMYLFQIYKANVRTVITSCILLAIGIHAQVFIVIPIGFYFLVWLISEKKISLLFYTALILSLSVIVFKLPAYLNIVFWKATINTELHLSHYNKIFMHLIPLINGSYFYELIFPLGKLLTIFSVSYFVVPLLVLVLSIIMKTNIKSIIYLFLGTLLSLIAIGFMHMGIYRYMLGFFTGLMLIIFVVILSYTELKRKWHQPILILFVILGIGCAWGVKNIPAFWAQSQKNDMVMYNGLINELKAQNIHHVFVIDLLGQWMLNYSGIASRSISSKERVNRFLLQVNECNESAYCKTALVGLVGYFHYQDSIGTWDKNVVIVNERFFFYPNPKPQHLKAAGFE